MANPEIDIHVPSGFRLEDINTYDPADMECLWELMLFESPWKRKIEAAQPASDAQKEERIRKSVEPEGSTILAARGIEDGVIRSTMQIVAKTFMDAGNTAEMGYVSTHPDYTQRGLFTAVWGRGLQWLVEKEVGIMTWNSNPGIEHRAKARSLYIKFGAEVVAVSPNPEDMEAGTDYFKLNVVRGIDVYRQHQAQRPSANT